MWSRMAMVPRVLLFPTGPALKFVAVRFLLWLRTDGRGRLRPPGTRVGEFAANVACVDRSASNRGGSRRKSPACGAAAAIILGMDAGVGTHSSRSQRPRAAASARGAARCRGFAARIDAPAPGSRRARRELTVRRWTAAESSRCGSTIFSAPAASMARRVHARRNAQFPDADPSANAAALRRRRTMPAC